MMRTLITSRIIRTTIDMDDPIPQDLKRLQRQEGKFLAQLVCDLLAQGVATRLRPAPAQAPFEWISRKMGGRVDLADKDALRDLVDQPRL
jgi:hypothetical protein